MTTADPGLTIDRAMVHELWYRRGDEGGAHIREALILHYSPLVKYVAGRVAVGLPRTIDLADLISYGMFGLIDAIDKFEPERGFKFETYAMTRIRGAIVDELRSIDWVPRSVRAKARAIEMAYARLESVRGGSPTDVELVAELGWTDEQFQRALGQISTSGLVALDDLVVGSDRGEPITVGDTIADTGRGPTDAVEVAETRRALAEVIQAMPEREKVVLGLYYYENLTLAEIGKVLGVTESRVSQIRTKAVLHLRQRLSGDDRRHVAHDSP